MFVCVSVFLNLLHFVLFKTVFQPFICCDPLHFSNEYLILQFLYFFLFAISSFLLLFFAQFTLCFHCFLSFLSIFFGLLIYDTIHLVRGLHFFQTINSAALQLLFTNSWPIHHKSKLWIDGWDPQLIVSFLK